MGLSSLNADRYGISYAWGGINAAYKPYGAIGHPGVDFPANYQPIYAEFPGTVVGRLWGDGYGWHIKVKDIDGDTWLYAHLSEFKVAVGQQVKRGQVIATSGATGFVTGPHCHLEVFPQWGGFRDYYGTVDPIKYLAEETRLIETVGQVSTPSGGGEVMNDDTSRQVAYHYLGRHGRDGKPNALSSPQELQGRPLTNAELGGIFLSPESRRWRDVELPALFNERDALRGQVKALATQLKDVQTALANEKAKPPVEVVKEVEKIVEKPVEVVREVEVEPSWLKATVAFIRKVLKIQ